MSILIKGAGLPKSCHNCPCAVELFDYCDNTHSCECNILQKNTTNYSTERREDCPLIEVPEFFGDLIERDAVLNVCEFIGERNDMEYLGNDNYAARYEEIEKIPAIIRKEE